MINSWEGPAGCEGLFSLKKTSCEIICVGTEILLGDIVNTNAQYIAAGLAKLGIDVYYQTVVGDNAERFGRALEIAKGRADVIITTGGLGPTYDDLTKETVAESFGRKLMMNERCLNDLTCFFAHNHRTMTVNNKKQAMMPEGSIVLDNPQGTAPGCIIEGEDGKIAIMMPGPPREMKPMFDNLVAPYLKKYSDSMLFSRVIRVIGLGESTMEERVLDIMESMTNPTVAPYAKSGECILRVTAKAHDEAEAHRLMDPVVEEIKSRLGDYVYGVDVDSIERHVVGLLNGLGRTIALAEVGTGGMAVERLSEVAGSAEVLKLGMTSGSLSGMDCLIGKRERPEGPTHDALQDAAISLASGIKELTRADLGVGLIKGAGTICIAVVDGMKVKTETYDYPSSRDAEYVDLIASSRAFDMIRRFLNH